MTTELSQAIARLEAAWQSVGHPFSDASIRRPPGRPPAETQQVAADLLGFELPAELVELWEWWGSDEFPVRSGERRPSFSFRHFPDNFYIQSLEKAVNLLKEHRDAELITTEETMNWVPAFSSQDSIVFGWVEVNNVDSQGRVPVTVAFSVEDPDEIPTRFESIASFVTSLAKMLEDGDWVDLGTRWYYPEEYG